MGSQRVGHNWATELNWTELIWQYLWYLGISDMAISRISFKLKTLLYSVPIEPISSYLNLLWLQWSGCLQLSCSVLFFFPVFLFSKLSDYYKGDRGSYTEHRPGSSLLLTRMFRPCSILHILSELWLHNTLPCNHLLLQVWVLRLWFQGALLDQILVKTKIFVVVGWLVILFCFLP